MQFSIRYVKALTLCCCTVEIQHAEAGRRCSAFLVNSWRIAGASAVGGPTLLYFSTKEE